MRWSLYLSEFNVKLVHIAGTKIVQSDALSRRPDFTPEEDTDNENITMLLDELFMNLIDTELQEQILTCEKLDSDAMEALKVLLEAYNSIRQHYWWPGLRTYVKNYVQGCGTCQQFKINRQPTRPSFLPTEGASTTRPFVNCSMDFITDLPLVKGRDAILVVVDQGLTKGIILIPCSKTITAEETAQLLLENLYKRFGLPDKIISDQGPQFASKAFVELLKLLGIKSSLSTTYHPQTDGTTERINQEIEAYLAIYCASHPEEWLAALHTLEFTHNNRRHADRQKTPFKLMFGVTTSND